MFHIKKQISNLYLSAVLGNLSLTGAWVAILSARGYRLVEIGLVEMIFHITSIIFEIPSGILADLFGRKRMLLVSSIMRMIGNVIMILSCNLWMVCVSISFHAMSYNFASGSGDALAYDSLKMAENELYFEKYSSNQLIIYRLCSGISTLCAGFALFIGYRLAYGTDILMGIIQMCVLLSLQEVYVEEKHLHSIKNKAVSFKKEFITCFMESLSFLKREDFAVRILFCNSIVGAIDILLLFFLQSKLPVAGMPGWMLGLALFFMEIGGIVGAKIVFKFKKYRYKVLFVFVMLLVLSGVFLEHSQSYVIMMFGGFIAALGDDGLQVRTNTILQDMFPSKQRATLISIESFVFSVIMIVLSPLAGVFFSWW